MFKNTLQGVAFGFALFAAFGSQEVSANSIVNSTYVFTGDCTDCTGVGTGTLVLSNYTLGNALTSGNFISLGYTSNLINFSITSATLASISGSLPVSLPGVATLSITANVGGNMLVTNINGNGGWCAGSSCSGDFGGTSSFANAPTGTPEPATLLMSVVGIAAISLVRRKQSAVN